MRLLALVVVVAVGSIACPPPCDRSTCSGCCEPGGECMPGTSRGFCGRGGAMCGSCPLSQRCQAGACVSPPDAGPVDAGPQPANCSTGCLSASLECQPGNLPEACGSDAGACVMCAAMSERCEGGRCVPTACRGCLDALGVCRTGGDLLTCGSDGGLCSACAPGQQCRAGVCATQGCGLTTCATGCCRGDVCQTPTSSACGLNGSACITCTSGRTCVGGVCQ